MPRERRTNETGKRGTKKIRGSPPPRQANGPPYEALEAGGGKANGENVCRWRDGYLSSKEIEGTPLIPTCLPGGESGQKRHRTSAENWRRGKEVVLVL